MVTGDGEVSDETRQAAEEAQQRARDLPLGDVPRIAADALTAGGEDMTPDEVRELAVLTLEKAQELSYLMGRLAALLGVPGGGT